LSEEVKVSDVNKILEHAETLAKDMHLPLKPDLDAEKAAKEAYQGFKSDSTQKEIQSYTTKLKEENFKDVLKNSDMEALKNLSDGERIYVFISSSMPVETIRNYVKAIDSIDDPRVCMVMKGFIGDITDVKKTLAFIRKLLMKDPTCNDATCKIFKTEILIDPMLFRLYDIKTVPSIVYATNVFVTDPEQSEGQLSNPDGLKISGDVSLEYSLEKMEEKSHSGTLKSILNKMKASFYNG